MILLFTAQLHFPGTNFSISYLSVVVIEFHDKKQFKGKGFLLADVSEGQSPSQLRKAWHLSYFSSTVTKFNDKGNLEKKAFTWAYRFKGVESMMLEQGHVSRDS